MVGIAVDDGDRGLGFFDRLLRLDVSGGATTQEQRLGRRSRECDEDEDCELH